MIKTIVIDLTPVLPGGENGGAKVFTLDLVRYLAAMNPETKFILLTQSSSHEELASMDRFNVWRVQTLGGGNSQPIEKFIDRVFARFMTRFPSRLKRVILKIWGLFKSKILGHIQENRSFLKNLRADLLFCPFTAPTYYEKGIPVVCTLYDLQYKTYPQFFPEEEVIHRDRVFVETCQKATAIAAISNYSRDSAIRHGSIAPERIRTIHLHLAQRISGNETIEIGILNQFGLASRSYLIYPANFWKHKNHEMLLTAFGLACKNNLRSSIKLVFTGTPGEGQSWLIEASRSMGLGDMVVFPGYVSNEDLSVLVGQSKGMIFPSLYEGFGIPVIEAMALGVPVACSNTTSLPEIAGEAALLFDPRRPDQIADAIISLSIDENLRSNLIRAGYQRAKEFSNIDQMAYEYWSLFQEAASNSVGRVSEQSNTE